jgi:hypothetical protein
MMRILLFVAMMFLPAAQAATGGGKGKIGSVADSGHGSSGAGGGGHSTRMPYDPRNAPPLADKRKVSEQDCTKPIDPQAGNLRCK